MFPFVRHIGTCGKKALNPTNNFHYQKFDVHLRIFRRRTKFRRPNLTYMTDIGSGRTKEVSDMG